MKDIEKRKTGKAVTSEKQRRRVAVYQRLQAKPETVSVTEWINTIAKDYRISPATVRRWSREVEIYGAHNEKTRTTRGPSKWDNAAISWIQGYYLKAIRNVGECSKKAAYKALCRRAAIEGWNIGSESSAYQYLASVHPLLIKFAKGGNRALDNFFYISRDLSTLKPFQIVVGDQHTFNFWVRDPDSPKKIFRPDCYLWLDMGTRLVYGLDFDKKYSTRTVKTALKSGVQRFGAFGCTYNDNGKPEISKAMNQIISELQSWGMKNADLSDLYRTDEGGYIVEDEEGSIIGYAKDQEEWYKFHRRILANVRNAKAKPIERFFKTLEQLLIDSRCPGLVRNINASAAEDEEAKRRLKQQEHDLLTADEFAHLVVSCIDEYESRRHEALGISPRQRLMEWVEQGWKPVRLREEDIAWIFMEREFRKVTSGRIHLGTLQYLGEELKERDGYIDKSVGILHYEGKKIEVRYDPDQPEIAYALADGRIRPLTLSRQIEMLDSDALAEEMSKKRGQMSSVRTAFKNLTEPIEASTIKTEKTVEFQDAKKKGNDLEDQSKRISAEEVNEEVRRRLEQKKITPFEKKIFETAGERYKYCLLCLSNNHELREEDKRFKKQFEDALTGDEAVYWQEYRRLLSV